MTENDKDISPNEEKNTFTGKDGEGVENSEVTVPNNEEDFSHAEQIISSSETETVETKRKFKPWYVLIIVLVAITLAFFLYKYVTYTEESDQTQETVEEVEETAKPIEEDPDKIDFDALMAQNPETKAWLTIPGTNIDYVVVQADEVPTSNTDYFYLHNDFYGNPSENGTLFFEPTDIIGEDITGAENYYSQNLIIFGHNMKSGEMFGQLTDYADEQFYKEHPTINLATPDGEFTYEIFAVCELAVTPTDADPEPFYYIQPDFATQDDFMAYIEKAKSRSLYDIPVEVQPGDEILTLSTCSDTDDNARFVVFAKKIPVDVAEL